MRICSARPYEGKEKYIFASYCHKDKAKVFPIIERLAKDGYRVWYDEGIDPGAEWPEIIAEHLNGAAVCLAFISEAALNSHNCRREINFALMKRKYFISVLLEQVHLSLGMEMQLSSAQSIFKHALSSDEEFFRTLYKAQEMRECLGRPNPRIVVSTAEDFSGETGENEKKRESFSDNWFVNGDAGYITPPDKMAGEKAEAARKAAEEEAARKAAEEAAARKAAEEAAARKAAEEAARKAAEEEAARKAAEEAAARKAAEEAARKAAEEAAQIAAKEEAAQKALEEARRREAEAARKVAEAEAAWKAAEAEATQITAKEEAAQKALKETHCRKTEATQKIAETKAARKAAEKEAPAQKTAEVQQQAEEEQKVSETRKRAAKVRKAGKSAKVIWIIIIVAVLIAVLAAVLIYQAGKTSDPAEEADHTDAGESMEAKYESGLYNMEHRKYADAVACFTDIEGYKDSAILKMKCEWKYVNKHSEYSQAFDRQLAYEYLNDLISEKYPGAQECYDRLFAWRIEDIRVNNKCNTRNSNNIKRTSISVYDPVYFHFKLAGGPPDAGLKLKVKYVYPDGESATHTWESECYAGPGQCYGWPAGIYDSPDKGALGTLTLTFFDEEGNQIGKGSVKIVK